jgi:hypothetical protein
MKKTYLLFIICLIAFNAKAQTTLKYSGNATTTYFGINYKIGGISEMDVKKPADQIGIHIGHWGQATNALGLNVGVYGTTSQNTFGSAYSYIGVYGNNVTNALNEANASVYGGYFLARNFGTNAFTTGVYTVGTGTNNTSTVIGLDAEASNNSNTTANKTIAVRGVTTSGSTTSTSYQDVTNPGGFFSSNNGQGVYGTTTDGYSYLTAGKISQGVTGFSNISNAFINAGVLGTASGSGTNKYGIWGYLIGSTGTGLSAAVYANDAIGVGNSYAGFFQGKVTVNGNLLVNGNSGATGTKTFMIDHPLDPENKILRHAAIESNEVLNQYSGNVITDASGFATVTLPDYFETLNTDFRYQLTAIGSFSQVIVKKKIANNKFVIQSKDPKVEVSWQVTGVRNDKVMQYQPFVAETEKTGNEKGNYLSPEAYGKSKQSEQMIPAFGHKNLAMPSQDAKMVVESSSDKK